MDRAQRKGKPPADALPDAESAFAGLWPTYIGRTARAGEESGSAAVEQLTPGKMLEALRESLEGLREPLTGDVEEEWWPLVVYALWQLAHAAGRTAHSGELVHARARFWYRLHNWGAVARYLDSEPDALSPGTCLGSLCGPSLRQALGRPILDADDPIQKGLGRRLPSSAPARARDMDDALCWLLLARLKNHGGILTTGEAFSFGWMVGVVMQAFEDRRRELETRLGIVRREQQRRFGRERGSELHKKAERERVRWRTYAAELRKQNPNLSKPGRKTQLAKMVKQGLDLMVSIQTIRKAL